MDRREFLKISALTGMAERIKGLVIVVIGLAMLGGPAVGRATALDGRAPSPNHVAQRITGPLSISGGRLVDATSSPVRLTGIDDTSMAPGSGAASPPGDGCAFGWAERTEFTSMATDGFNSVRLAWTWANEEPNPPKVVGPELVHAWNSAYEAALVRMVNGYTAAGLVVILDHHKNQWSPAFKSVQSFQGTRCEGVGFPSWLYPNGGGEAAIAPAVCELWHNAPEPGVPEAPQDGFAAAWQRVASLFVGNRQVVAADVFNEPQFNTGCPARQSDLSGFYGRLGQAVALIEPGWVIGGEDHGDKFQQQVRPSIGSYLFSWHYYERDWATGRPILDAFRQRAVGWGSPLWIGEFNTQLQGADLSQWQSHLSSLMAYCKANDVSWTFFDRDFITNRRHLDVLPLLQTGM